MLAFLFKSYTSSFYGLEVIYDRIPTFLMNRISVAYHKAVKKIAGLNTWDSNHEACETVGVFLFKHLLAKRQLCFWNKLSNSVSPCLANLKYYFRSSSHVFIKLQQHFNSNYSVNISCNPLCAILARIFFVQRTEPRSNYAREWWIYISLVWYSLVPVGSVEVSWAGLPWRRQWSSADTRWGRWVTVVLCRYLMIIWLPGSTQRRWFGLCPPDSGNDLSLRGTILKGWIVSRFKHCFLLYVNLLLRNK